jgi:hypothetical protein
MRIPGSFDRHIFLTAAIRTAASLRGLDLTVFDHRLELGELSFGQFGAGVLALVLIEGLGSGTVWIGWHATPLTLTFAGILR